MVRRTVLIPTLDGLFREHDLETDDPKEYHDAIVLSGDTAATFLETHVIKKVRPVLVRDYASGGKVKVVIRQIGHFARMHVDAWRSHQTETTEKALRNSVKHWTQAFPSEQWQLAEDLYVQYLDTLPDSARRYAWYDAPRRVCVVCGDYEDASSMSFELCDACRFCPSFQAGVKKHLDGILAWNQGGGSLCG